MEHLNIGVYILQVRVIYFTGGGERDYHEC